VHIMSHEVLELFTESKEGEPCTTATTTIRIHHLESRMTQNQEGENDEIMHMFDASGVYIQMSPWRPPFIMLGRQGCAIALKITLSRGQLKCKKGRMMRICLSWI
jgi:acyl-CoA reductase-like NAD-dependent aldehyde dehydrogenase